MPEHHRPQRLDLPDVALDYENKADRAQVTERMAAVQELRSRTPTMSAKEHRYNVLDAMGVFKRMGLEDPRDRKPTTPTTPAPNTPA